MGLLGSGRGRLPYDCCDASPVERPVIIRSTRCWWWTCRKRFLIIQPWWTKGAVNCQLNTLSIPFGHNGHTLNAYQYRLQNRVLLAKHQTLHSLTGDRPYIPECPRLHILQCRPLQPTPVDPGVAWWRDKGWQAESLPQALQWGEAVKRVLRAGLKRRFTNSLLGTRKDLIKQFLV